MKNILSDKGTRLFIILGGFFIANALVAEFIGVKIFSLENTLGLEEVSWTILGVENLSFALTAGVLLWPVVFIMTDILNEYFGMQGVRMLSYLAIGLITYAFIMIFFAMGLEPAGFWPTSHLEAKGLENLKLAEDVKNYDSAFKLVFGQGLWIITGSLVAFLVGQLVDVFIFHKIKEKTGEGKVWLRATGSTIVSQFIDSYVVLIIAFYLGADWDLIRVLAIGTVNFFYKFSMAILLTPVIYIAHYLIDGYLGKEKAQEMKRIARL